MNFEEFAHTVQVGNTYAFKYRNKFGIHDPIDTDFYHVYEVHEFPGIKLIRAYNVITGCPESFKCPGTEIGDVEIVQGMRK